MMPVQALTGCMVLDLGIITAGAATSAMLADAGARVIKIESESYPDPFRKWSGTGLSPKNSSSPAFEFTNRNKLGVSLDLKTPQGRAAFLRLARGADVIVENFRRGVLDRLGLGFEELKRQNPRIVLASLSSQGETGPQSHFTSFGSTLEAMGGLAALTGYAGEHPQISGKTLNFPDQAVSIFAFGAIIAALLAAKRTGQGAHIDISQRELIVFMVGEYIAADSMGQNPLAEGLRRGNADPGGCFQGCFQTAERKWIAITAPSDQARIALATLCGVAPSADLSAAVTAFVSRSSADLVAESLENIGVSANRVLPAGEILALAKTADWHAIMRDPAGALVKGVPFRNAIAPFQIGCAAPKLGEHTKAVLAEFGINPELSKTKSITEHDAPLSGLSAGRAASEREAP